MQRFEQNLSWTRRQRAVIATLLLGLMVIISWRAWRHADSIADPPPPRPPHGAMLADRVDPNTAELIILAMLPGVGEARAQAMVDYRDAHAAQAAENTGHAGAGPAFTSLDDLLKVPGFGNVLVEQLQPHLMFPSPAAREPGDSPAGSVELD